MGKTSKEFYDIIYNQPLYRGHITKYAFKSAQNYYKFKMRHEGTAPNFRFDRKLFKNISRYRRR